MTTLIGATVTWSGTPLNQALARRFAQSFAVGTPTEVQSATCGPALLISSRQKKGWSPALNGNGQRVLFTGHISNRAWLASELRVGADNNAEIYAKAYEEWGEAADIKLIGEYATVLFDPKSLTVRLSRSPIAAPPLHYWRGKDQFIVASTPRCILATGAAPAESDEQKIADAAFRNYSEGGRSWFKDIMRLPVGSRAFISRSGCKVETYYDFMSLPDVRLKSDDDYIDALEALFKEATRAALDGFSRPAVSLSGGFDSQAVAAFTIGEIKGGPLLGLTSVPEAGWDGKTSPRHLGDERAHVFALAGMHPALQIHLVDAAGLGMDHKLEELFALAGVPPRNELNMPWLHDVWSVAQSNGNDVVLTGAMGNNTFSFSGDGALGGWFWKGQWGRIIHELSHINSRQSLARKFAGRVIKPLLPDRVAGLLWPQREPSPFDTWCPLDPVYARDMRVEERARSMGVYPYGAQLHSTVLAENRRGLQGADWRLRIGRQRDQIISEIDDFSQDADLSHRFDLRDLKQVLIDWPEGRADHPNGPERLQFALPKAYVMSKFVQHAKNAGSDARA